MKKSLLALAALATLAGAASAQQSSVTLSGSVDVGVKRTPSGTSTVFDPITGLPVGTVPNGDQNWSMGSAASSRTAITLSGTEQITPGLRAFFLLNHRFEAATGESTSSPNFWRQSWVGLGGNFGDVRLGRMLPPEQEFNGQYEAWDGGDTVANVHTGGPTSGALQSRYSSAAYYRSPNFVGLQLHAMVADAQANGGTEKPLGAGLQYKGGPISAALAYDRNQIERKSIGAYGSYDFVVLKLMAQYERFEINDDGDKNQRASISALIPVGPAVIKVGGAKYGGVDTKKYGLGVDYNLSKRTSLYSDLAKTSGDGASKTGAYSTGGGNMNSKVAFDAGIRHKF